MKFTFNTLRALSAGLMLSAVAGCTHSGAPSPLAVERMPVEFDKGFGGARAEARNLAHEVAASVRAQDYSRAFMNLQALTTQSGLTKAQCQLAARGLLTLNGLLQSAQAKGDQQAAAVLTYQRMTK